MTPAVAPGPQVRRTAPSVGRKRSRDLFNLQMEQCRFDHHLAGEFHSRRAQIQSLICLPAESAQSAMEVAARTAVEQSADAREDGIPQILVQGWHGMAQDPALEAVAHYQVVAGAQFIEKTRGVAEV